MRQPSPPETDHSLQKALARYAVPRRSRAVSNVLTAVVPYVGLIGAACVALRFSPWLAGGLSVIAAGFLLRTFIVFHDCAHSSFLPSKRANALLGAALGVLVYTPFAVWRREHAIHHATAGDLDRRGVGDVQTLTVDEYHALPMWGRLRYWLFRNPFVMFGLGPLWVVLLGPRVVSWSTPSRLRRSVLGNDLALIAADRRALLAARLAGVPDRPAAGAPRVGQHRDLALLRPAPVRGHLLAVRRELVVRRRRAPGQLVPAAPAGAAVHHRQHRPAPRPPSERAHPELQPAGRSRRERGAPQPSRRSRSSTGCERRG